MASGGTSISFDPNDANMLVQNYAFDLRLSHYYFSSVNSILSDYTIIVTPCLLDYVTWDTQNLI